ncbi:MAG TPA: DciA family protein [Casimicrobiaceae bacterium]|nr:DciA family protein [Casimicrobiaceae bacterium]
MPAPPKYRSIANVLKSEAGFTDWTARAALEADLTKRVRRHLPRTLADRVRVTEWRDGVLELAATAGAIAATLRQRATDLRLALARDGIECREIHVRVQVAGVAMSRERRAPRAWNSADAKPMFELGERLPDGPLKAAIARWSRRARGR